jgi:hypothetical protein
MLCPSRRIEDRIREVGSRLIFAGDRELQTLITELQALLNEYARRGSNGNGANKNSARANVIAWPGSPRDRRKLS